MPSVPKSHFTAHFPRRASPSSASGLSRRNTDYALGWGAANRKGRVLHGSRCLGKAPGSYCRRAMEVLGDRDVCDQLPARVHYRVAVESVTFLCHTCELT